MFISKRRQIVTPQSEHLKLVGTLAMLWGNNQFDTPPIERESMVMGMGLHDRGYGYLDNAPIGSLGDEVWEGIARRTFDMECSDIVADTIVKYHFRRLAGHGTSEIRKTLHTDFTEGIRAQLEKYNLSQTLFDRTDRITNLLDTISFEFCFDVPTSGSVPVFSRNGVETEEKIEYHVENGEINVDPWPFSVNEHHGYLIAYHAEGYPDRLDLVILPYLLKRK